ncbi:hypothetical protein [Bosea sp. NBC_00550]|uniref:hypothetical protein n=1 Tax=Bosea sp. NBC_00550 TaxID=2969621 RepID=UPI0022308D18|nr:hypothetical protein [Bosea sp. NBC_00550]UZF95528.1 hypothetical protein NWE53_29055 [Bosea sp. NBC_00550]
MPRLVIRDEEEMNAAIERAQELMGFTNDSDEEREMAEIADAVKVYEDALALMTGVGARAAGKPDEGVPSGSGSK